MLAMVCPPSAGQAIDQPRCAITSIQLGALTKSLPLNEPEFVEGQVEVMCSSTSPHSQTVEFGLIEVDSAPSRNERSATSTTPSPHIRVDLFSDGAGRTPLPLKASELNDYPTRRVIPSSGTAQLSIPFYARVVVGTLLSAGDYNIARDIVLVYRTSDPMRPVNPS